MTLPNLARTDAIWNIGCYTQPVWYHTTLVFCVRRRVKSLRENSALVPKGRLNLTKLSPGRKSWAKLGVRYEASPFGRVPHGREFPVGSGGFHKLHAPFLKERRTRGPVSSTLQEIRVFAPAYMGRKWILPMLSLYTHGTLALGRGLLGTSQKLGWAAPSLVRPMYAGANMGHPSRANDRG
jgi:hypothetical protein